MVFEFDGTGIVVEERKGEKKLMPKGNYNYEIVDFTSAAGNVYPLEGTTKNGAPKVDFLAEVTDGPFKGTRVFHSVTFLPKDSKGSGMSIHFLKTIGQPWEGKFSVNPSEWVGTKFRGYTIEDEYNGKKNNKIKGIEPIEDSIPF